MLEIRVLLFLEPCVRLHNTLGDPEEGAEDVPTKGTGIDDEGTSGVSETGAGSSECAAIGFSNGAATGEADCWLSNWDGDDSGTF